MIEKIKGFYKAQDKNGFIEKHLFQFVFKSNNEGYLALYEKPDSNTFFEVPLKILQTGLHGVIDIKFTDTSPYFNVDTYRLEIERGILVIYPLPVYNQVAVYSFISV